MNDKPRITGEQFDEMFDNGQSISDYVEWSSAHRPGREAQHVGLDLPLWIVERLDRHAKQDGVTREALIARWLSERLDEQLYT